MKKYPAQLYKKRLGRIKQKSPRGLFLHYFESYLDQSQNEPEHIARGVEHLFRIFRDGMERKYHFIARIPYGFFVYARYGFCHKTSSPEIKIKKQPVRKLLFFFIYIALSIRVYLLFFLAPLFFARIP